jgi:pyridoxamine 5'-phosphate oxidase
VTVTHEAKLADLWRQEPVAIRETLFGLLTEASARRQSPLHTVALATTSVDGLPDARTVVFRGFDPAIPACRIHTDVRSPKVAALRRNPQAVLLWYAAEWKLQLRARATIMVHHLDEVATHYWEASQVRSRRAYRAPHPPGTMQPDSVTDLAPDIQDAEATEANTAAGFAHFTVLLATLEDLEWLTLSASGNRRGRLRFAAPDSSGWRHEWLAP